VSQADSTVAPEIVPADDPRALIERAEHVSNIAKFRAVTKLGLVVWPATFLLDILVCWRADAGPLWAFAVLRVLGIVAIALVLWRLARRRPPSPRTMAILDVGLFSSVSAMVGGMCLLFGGVASPYSTGILTIMIARGSVLFGPFSSGILRFGAPVAAYMSVFAIAAATNARVAAQFANARASALFIASLVFMITAWALLTAGGHVVWTYRRQVIEARSIGRYRLRRRIGRGGMGEVWEAYDGTLRRPVALKLLRPERVDAIAIERFEREARATAELTHPNTIRVTDFGVSDDGLWYYAMELLEGRTLRDSVQEQGALPPAVVAHYGSRIARALAEAHARGVVHRDVSPSNIFIAMMGGEADIPKLLDFGIVRRLQTQGPDLTGTGLLIGTPGYIAPEVIEGKPADARSDLYALGATLYFAVTGRHPYNVGSVTAVMGRQIAEEAVPISQRAPGVPAAMTDMIMKCLRRTPRDRPSSADEVAHALEQLSSIREAAGAESKEGQRPPARLEETVSIEGPFEIGGGAEVPPEE
jgi:hypothetical protein